jgi:glutaconate CoA-transferase subunit A
MSFTKQMTAANAVASLWDGMTIGIGGWGPRRKPMALVREILRSDLKDLTVVAYGGPEVGMLCAAGKVKKLIFGFVSLDKIPVEPWFRRAREAGGFEVSELDEGMLQWGLKAAAMRLPFLPTRAGLGTDITTYNPDFRTVRSPYDDGEVLLAMPALHLDAALLHVHEADVLGNTRIFGPDPYFDEHYARAADRCYVTCEVIHERLDRSSPETAQANYFERNVVTGVVHAPFGAHPTACAPRYGWDMAHLKNYVAAAREEAGWAGCAETFVGASEAEYLGTVGGEDAIGRLPLPVF